MLEINYEKFDKIVDGDKRVKNQRELEMEMKAPVSDEDNPYGTAHFMQKRTYIGWRGPIIADAIFNVLHPKTVIDVGCGIGEIAKGLLDLKIDVIGIEGSTAGQEYYKLPLDRYRYLDIRRSFIDSGYVVRERFDLVICLEVLSVIKNENNCHYTIIENLKSLSNDIFMNRIDEITGYKEMLEITEKIQSHLLPWKHKSGMKALFSAKLFRKEE